MPDTKARTGVTPLRVDSTELRLIPPLGYDLWYRWPNAERLDTRTTRCQVPARRSYGRPRRASRSMYRGASRFQYGSMKGMHVLQRLQSWGMIIIPCWFDETSKQASKQLAFLIDSTLFHALSRRPVLLCFLRSSPQRVDERETVMAGRTRSHARSMECYLSRFAGDTPAAMSTGIGSMNSGLRIIVEAFVQFRPASTCDSIVVRFNRFAHTHADV